jgi:hypothetical protein
MEKLTDRDRDSPIKITDKRQASQYQVSGECYTTTSVRPPKWTVIHQGRPAIARARWKSDLSAYYRRRVATKPYDHSCQNCDHVFLVKYATTSRNPVTSEIAQGQIQCWFWQERPQNMMADNTAGGT